jgi:hypothetical protein
MQPLPHPDQRSEPCLLQQSFTHSSGEQLRAGGVLMSLFTENLNAEVAARWIGGTLRQIPRICLTEALSKANSRDPS